MARLGSVASHFNSNSPVPADYRQNLQRIADLGVDVQITELGIEGSGSAQAADDAGVVAACLVVSRCTGLTVRGVTGTYSRRSGGTPLLCDGGYAEKPACGAVLSALGGSGDPGDPGDPGDGTVSSTATYTRTAGAAVTTAGSRSPRAATRSAHGPRRSLCPPGRPSPPCGTARPPGAATS